MRRAGQSGVELAGDLAGFGKPPERVLREDLLAVNDHVKDAVRLSNKGCFYAEQLLQLSRQTGGPGKVVSSSAVRDFNLHPSLPFRRPKRTLA